MDGERDEPKPEAQTGTLRKLTGIVPAAEDAVVDVVVKVDAVVGVVVVNNDDVVTMLDGNVDER